MRIENLPELPPGEWSHCEYRAAKPGEFVLMRDKELRWIQWTLQNNSVLEWLVLVPAKKYREPVLPADWGKECEFSNDKKTWVKGNLAGFLSRQMGNVVSMHQWHAKHETGNGDYISQFKFARIEVSE